MQRVGVRPVPQVPATSRVCLERLQSLKHLWEAPSACEKPQTAFQTFSTIRIPVCTYWYTLDAGVVSDCMCQATPMTAPRCNDSPMLARNNAKAGNLNCTQAACSLMWRIKKKPTCNMQCKSLS